jgi:hypothetical protein
VSLPRKHNDLYRLGIYNNERSLFINLLFAGLLGLGRPTAFALLSLRLQLPEVFSASLGDLLPALPSKTDGCGILRFRQNWGSVISTPNSIMHDVKMLRPE